MDTRAFFQITKSDNVATALDDITAGTAKIKGYATMREITVLAPIKKGHKVAIRKINKGGKIVKYGVVIAVATADIKPGEWVHLHNSASLYDTRSASLDIDTGTPRDTKYE